MKTRSVSQKEKDKEYTCQYCRKRFKIKRRKDEHEKSRHPDRFPFKCFSKTCSMIFRRKSNYVQHLNYKHPEVDKAKLFGKKGSDSSQFQSKNKSSLSIVSMSDRSLSQLVSSGIKSESSSHQSVLKSLKSLRSSKIPSPVTSSLKSSEGKKSPSRDSKIHREENEFFFSPEEKELKEILNKSIQKLKNRDKSPETPPFKRVQTPKKKQLKKYKEISTEHKELASEVLSYSSVNASESSEEQIKESSELLSKIKSEVDIRKNLMQKYKMVQTDDTKKSQQSSKKRSKNMTEKIKDKRTKVTRSILDFFTKPPTSNSMVGESQIGNERDDKDRDSTEIGKDKCNQARNFQKNASTQQSESTRCSLSQKEPGGRSNPLARHLPPPQSPNLTEENARRKMPSPADLPQILKPSPINFSENSEQKSMSQESIHLNVQKSQGQAVPLWLVKYHFQMLLNSHNLIND
ncbi:unnamed protein product [Moneuplotes crassus]|uniref:C2H2-type domain-containing protein n=1 Tax=Euplotes crassus TaxID=5936 RepID=A0AAD1X5X6_EUPCR|nr:unnamed protein product [Moneuplotes crassus]